MKRNNAYIVFMLVGIVLCLAGTVWLAVNFHTERHGGEVAEETVLKLQKLTPVRASEAEEAHSIEFPTTEIPDYVLAPQREMPTKNVDGIDYIAQLRLPSLDLELPVASDWSYETLRITPCRFYGSAYTNDLVILAHNYSTHFGELHRLVEGDTVELTDMDGNIFRYEVKFIEIMEPTAVEEMIESEFDLSLFTCTVGGKMRVCARCTLVEDVPLLLDETQIAEKDE